MSEPRDTGRFDYIIVGAGTAGCLLANRLSADPDLRVLLIEAGGRDTYPWIHIPVGYLYTMNNPRTDWCFHTEPDPDLNGRSLSYPRGRVLGGSSSINGMIYMRGQAGDYDHWRDLGNPGWGWDDVLPYFLRHEDHAFLDGPMHRQGGEWRVERQRLSWEILDVFRDAAAETGIPSVDDFNGGDNEGCGYFHVNQRRGVRVSAAKAFLRPALNRPNLVLFTDAQVARLQFEDRRVSGVTFQRAGRLESATVDGELILAAGAVGSPHLLQVSGVGPRNHLGEHGVAVVHDLPGVGDNLQDHLQIRTVFRVSGAKTLNQRVHSLASKAAMAIEYAVRRTGPLSMAPSQLGCFTRSDPGQPSANLEYHVQPLSTEKLGDPLHTFPAITASVCNLRPESRGSVMLRSADAREAPVIAPRYLATETDRRVAADAIRVTRGIMAARAFERFRPEELLPGDQAQSDEELARAAGDIGTTIFHPVGTCAMGSDPARGAVVDARLRVHGCDGLRVVDASVMP
ncbi:MAG TPA: GMC family oxidoreductase N-terminal domain-containing protein, partial [Gammaproteobacteria bacterium]|nr:GMC family oxidoreductase N-terminal domain-containing protein [Gammaproteobacteria bacterium]